MSTDNMDNIESLKAELEHERFAAQEWKRYAQELESKRDALIDELQEHADELERLEGVVDRCNQVNRQLQLENQQLRTED